MSNLQSDDPVCLTSINDVSLTGKVKQIQSKSQKVASGLLESNSNLFSCLGFKVIDEWGYISIALQNIGTRILFVSQDPSKQEFICEQGRQLWMQ